MSILTPNSATTAFCTPAQFVNLMDWRPFGQYCSDTDVAPASSAIFQTSPVLAAKLQVASGLIEMAATRGARYDPTDLMALATNLPISNGGWVLIQMTAGLAAYEIVGRRTEALTEYIRDTIDRSQAMLGALEAGEMIFPFTEAQQSGLLNDYKEVATDVELRNLPSFITKNMMGRRANRRLPNVGGTSPCDW